MKKIGYIYKYSEAEGLGILVHDSWKSYGQWGQISSVAYPILFSASNLIADVHTGQLVYFDFEDCSALNIEPASLTNFKPDYLAPYRYNSVISFERLENIIKPTEQQEYSSRENSRRGLNRHLCEEDFHKIYAQRESFDNYTIDVDDELLSYSWEEENDDVMVANESVIILPSKIEDLFNCFGKYNHKENETDTTIVDVLDLSLWVDQFVVGSNYFGSTIDNIKYLYDLFVMKRCYDKEGKEVHCHKGDDCISSSWSLLLSKFNDKELAEILEYAPKLQPALSVAFCKKHLDLLTGKYGMPDVEICKLHCYYLINRASTISDYKKIKEDLYTYGHCVAEHLEGEGVPMCKMGKETIEEFMNLLKVQYENRIKSNIITQISSLCDGKTIINKQNVEEYEFDLLGSFIETFEAFKTDITIWSLIGSSLLNEYNALPQRYKEAMKDTLPNVFNNVITTAIINSGDALFSLISISSYLSDWVSESSKVHIKKLVDEVVPKSGDVDLLNQAKLAGYIDYKQFAKWFIQVTKGFTPGQLLHELSSDAIIDYPLPIQWYILIRAIDLLGYKTTDSYDPVRISAHDSIHDIYSLLCWMHSQRGNRINEIVYKKAEARICCVLSNDEKKDILEHVYKSNKYYEDLFDNISYFSERTFDRYNGTYAQDVMGYSDDDIDTIFDGEPEAYWNID